MHGINDDFNGNANQTRQSAKEIEAFQAHYAPFCTNIKREADHWTRLCMHGACSSETISEFIYFYVCIHNLEMFSACVLMHWTWL